LTFGRRRCIACKSGDAELSHSVGKEIIKLDEARRLVARALALVVDAGDTLAAAELEQALDTVTRRLKALGVSSGSSPAPPSAIQ
jgi:hypothetical protein